MINFYLNSVIFLSFYDSIYVFSSKKICWISIFCFSTSILNLVLKIPRNINTHPMNIHEFITNTFKIYRFEI
jgi:hypothetical protein